MAEKILVTGGAGFIGSHLVDALLKQGHDIRVFDSLEPQVHGSLRERGEWPAYLALECEKILGDVRNREALLKAMKGIQVIFHQAAVVGVGQSMYDIERYTDVNTRGTAVLLDILANEKHQVRKLVVASSMSIYGEGQYHCCHHGIVYPRLRSDEQLAAREWESHCPICEQPVEPLPTSEDKPLYPSSIYAITKKDQEEMCLTVGRAYGIPTVALRYFNVYGPRQALNNPYTGVTAIFANRLLNGQQPFIFEDGRQRRDFIHVWDIVQANLLAMERQEADYSVFNVGSGSPLTIFDIAETLSRYLDSPCSPAIMQQYRSGDIRHCFADIGQIRALGFHPEIQFEKGIAELVDWLCSNIAADNFEQARSELVQRGLTI